MDWKQGIREQADLKIDYDTHRHNPIQRFNFRMKYVLKYMWWIKSVKVKVYRTKKGYHFYVYIDWSEAVNDMKLISPPMGAILTQCVLGSDWLRELRNFDRALIQQDKNWNILFSEKDKNGKMQYENFYCAYRLKSDK